MVTTPLSALPAPPRFRRVLRGLDMTLFTVCAVLIIDQLAASASIGVQSIFWWLLTLVLFFIPYGLVTAELGSTYPDEGGIYAWVHRAYGSKWAGRTAWLWWVNVALWMPSVYILFAGMLSELAAPQLGLSAKIGIALGLTWLTVGLNILTLNVGKWLPNIGAGFKVLIMLAIGVGGVLYATRHGVANRFDLASLRPQWGASLAFLPVIVYNYLGFELMSGAAEEMKDPARDVPKAIIRSGAIIAFFYIFATVGILLALPVSEIGLISGLPDTFHRLFDGYPVGRSFVYLLGIMALYTLMANMVTWTMGANRSAAEAAERGDLPRIFGKMHPTYRTPASSAILGGIVGTAMLLIYASMASSAEDLFWTTFAFSSVIFLLPYLLLFLSFTKLRQIDAAKPRPYRVPGGLPTARVLAWVCMAFIAQAVVFFIYKPGDYDSTYAAAVGGGVLITLLLGEAVLFWARSEKARA